jgi:hypothetical protein
MRAGDLLKSSRSHVSAFLRAMCLLVLVALSVAVAVQKGPSQTQQDFHAAAEFHALGHSEITGAVPEAGCAPATSCWAVPYHAGGHGAMTLSASRYGLPASDQFPATLFTALPEQPPRVSS